MIRAGPNQALLAGAVAIVVIEIATRSQARYAPECIAAAIALAVIWRRQDGLRVSALVGMAFALPAAFAVVHLQRHIGGDIDVQRVYPEQGQSLLDGVYPHSEYPPGAVLLFAAERLVGSVRAVNPFVMAVCQGVIVWAIATVPRGRAFAALVALWPVTAFFWEFKFDALPTALLLAGLALALDERWALSGAAFGLGAAVKWTPAIACVLLAVWLLRRGRARESASHVLAAGVAFSAVVVPFSIWSPGAVFASVSRQAPRGITPESLWYLPLRLAGKAQQRGAIYDAATVPHWANALAVAAQVATILLLLALVARRPPPLLGEVALAAVAPVLFLLLNKVFSAQYVVTILPAVCFAAALTGRRWAALLIAVAAVANVLVYPIGRFWLPASAVLFATALLAVLLVVRGTFRRLSPTAVSRTA